MNEHVSIKCQGIAASITLEIVAKAKQMRSEGIRVIDFGAGEPDQRTPQNIREAAIRAIETKKIGYTPAAGILELRQAICNKLKKDNRLNYQPENIVVSNGAKQSLYNALQAICNPGDEVIIPIPYWVSYPEMVQLADAIPVLIETKENEHFKYNPTNLLTRITPKTKAIILNSPNNPTGMVYSKEELRVIAEIAMTHNLFVISDEIYEKLIYNGEHWSIASFSERMKDLTIVVNGMSKCYAMTGWRIGYAAANQDVAAIMAKIQSHATSNPNTVAQYASVEALNGDQQPVLEMRKVFMVRRDYMVERVNTIPYLSCLKPEGAFYVMVNIAQLIGKKLGGVTIKNSIDFAKFILEKANIAAVPGEGFGMQNYIRFSYTTSMEDIKEGLARLKAILEGL